MSAAPEVRDDAARHRYEIDVDGEPAFAEYRIQGHVVTFVHTFVPEAARGRGIAGKLIAAALDDARRRSLRVVPECESFVAYIRRHPETLDLLDAEGLRAIEDVS